MIVRCANCHTEFSLDDQHIGPEGATVRCSVCSYVFPVDPPAGTSDQPWQIRTVEDLLFTAPDLATLRAWISEGRLHPDDQVSRTGRHWLRLGDMPEFSTAFSGFEDLPQVFEELPAPASASVSALDQLGPPPSFGGTMPVIQGVDTGMLALDGAAADLLADSGVGVVPTSVAIERPRPGTPSVLPSAAADPSGPLPFPLTEMGIDDDSSAAIRPRPGLSAVPDVVQDAPIEAHRSRRSHPTVRYGSDVHKAALQGRSLEELEVAEAPTPDPRPAAKRISPADESSEEIPVRSKSRRRAETIDDDTIQPRRSSWPLVAGLGLLAGVAIVFGVPSIRAKVLDVAGSLVGKEKFDPESLAELEQARTAMASLDPKALGQAEAALQGRLDSGDVPAQGVAAMKLAQVELLATRAIEQEIGKVVGSTAPIAGPDDLERATLILGGVVADDVIDRAQMRRVRARLRLAQGRPDSEILGLLPEDGSGELRQLVIAAPLWRDAKAPVPAGAIEGLEGLSERSALAELALALAYQRSGDEAKAKALASKVLEAVPEQPTALVMVHGVPVAVGETGPAPQDDGGSEGGETKADGGETKTDGGETKAPTEPPTSDDGGKDDGGSTPAPKKPSGPKVESLDSLIGKGCDAVESGNADDGMELLRKALARRPTDLDAQLCMGIGQAKQGNTSKALSTFEGILSRSPSFAPALKHAAKAADKLGQTDKAVGYYRKLLSLRPRDPTALAYVEAHG